MRDTHGGKQGLRERNERSMVLEQPWIGFVHVQPIGKMNPLGEGRTGAFAHVLALASGPDSYRDKTSRALEDNGLIVIEIENIALVDEYRAEGRIIEDLDDLIDALSPEYPVQFDTFDAYGELDS